MAGRLGITFRVEWSASAPVSMLAKEENVQVMIGCDAWLPTCGFPEWNKATWRK